MGTTEPSASVGKTTEGSAEGLAKGTFGRSLVESLAKTMVEFVFVTSWIQKGQAFFQLPNYRGAEDYKKPVIF